MKSQYCCRLPLISETALIVQELFSATWATTYYILLASYYLTRITYYLLPPLIDLLIALAGPWSPWSFEHRCCLFQPPMLVMLKSLFSTYYLNGFEWIFVFFLVLGMPEATRIQYGLTLSDFCTLSLNNKKHFHESTVGAQSARAFEKSWLSFPEHPKNISRRPHLFPKEDMHGAL